MPIQPIHLCPEVLESLLDELSQASAIVQGGLILRPRLEAYLASVTSSAKWSAATLETQMLAADVRAVFGANPSSAAAYGALIAAARLGIPRILLQHGDGLFPYESWLVTETCNFDEMWASDPTLMTDLPAAATRVGTMCPRIRVSSPRIVDLRRRIRGQGVSPDPTGPVCYVPCHFVGDAYSVGAHYFEDAWYHRWQSCLLDFMGEHPNLSFIWKAIPTANQVDDPIPSLIDRLGLDNVRYESRPLRSILSRPCRVVVDYPSTPLFETVHAGRAVLALWFPRFGNLRPRAADLFKAVLRQCDTPEEALDCLREFMDARPALWTLPKERLE